MVGDKNIEESIYKNGNSTFLEDLRSVRIVFLVATIPSFSLFQLRFGLLLFLLRSIDATPADADVLRLGLIADGGGTPTTKEFTIEQKRTPLFRPGSRGHRRNFGTHGSDGT